MSAVEPSIAGPKRPQDRIPLRSVRGAMQNYFSTGSGAGYSENDKESYERLLNNGGKETETQKRSASLKKTAQIELDGKKIALKNGSVVIAAITSCTNTSNPSVMIGAGLLAKKAVELGLKVSPHVKTSLAPGSRVVTQYLEKSGLLSYLEALGFHLVGYGCTTCIGNSGPLHPIISRAIQQNDLVAVSILSGNRNFEGRIHPDVRANFLASPPLVTAYAIAGTINLDLTVDPVGSDPNGTPIFLKDIWPTQGEIQKTVEENVSPSLFNEEYSNVFTGNNIWNDVKISSEKVYTWEPDSTYIRKPPFFEGIKRDIPEVPSIKGAHVLALFGDTITTDHISPAGAIPVTSPAGSWLIERGIKPDEFNTYGSRRGNHEVMIRGTFGNIRIKNALVHGKEGGYTLYLPTGEELSIYDAAMKYRKNMIPLLILAGKEYGAGSSRDWAAKGTALLGVRAVIAESFERIHRSNLIGMGVLPLQFSDDQNTSSLGLTGHEMFDIEDIKHPGQKITVKAVDKKGKEFQFSVLTRIDTQIELEYYKNSGILHKVIRKLAGEK
jgi:aconitate hydratase